MTAQSLSVPHTLGFDFGVGVDRLSGTPMNQVVNATPSPPMMAGGSAQSFTVSRIRSSRDLQNSLGIDIEASYGCASFGAGASARFSYVEESRVHSSSLFMTVTATVRHADLSIDNPVLTEPAKSLSDRQDVFSARFGDVFCRAQKRGGLFVGLMRIETFSATEANRIEGELRGSYGFFSADLQANFQRTIEQHNAAMYCTIYTEGGPNVFLNNPSNPSELLECANTWKESMYRQPDNYSVPYQWTLSETTIAEGPLPPNAADLQNCQDVLTFCARERTAKLDQYNLLAWFYEHPHNFDWQGSATEEELITAARATQDDLDTLASCASWAINNPSKALRPAAFAKSRGKTYPAGIAPASLPKEISSNQISLMANPDGLTESRLFDVPDSFQATTKLTVSFPAPSMCGDPLGDSVHLAAGIGRIRDWGDIGILGIAKYFDRNKIEIIGQVIALPSEDFIRPLWTEDKLHRHEGDSVYLRIDVANRCLISSEYSVDGREWTRLNRPPDPWPFDAAGLQLALFVHSEPGESYMVTFSKPEILPR
ncbi:hypothetical protein ACWDCO_17315 [Streptomyces albogriseolus]